RGADGLFVDATPDPGTLVRQGPTARSPGGQAVGTAGDESPSKRATVNACDRGGKWRALAPTTDAPLVAAWADPRSGSLWTAAGEATTTVLVDGAPIFGQANSRATGMWGRGDGTVLVVANETRGADAESSLLADPQRLWIAPIFAATARPPVTG